MQMQFDGEVDDVKSLEAELIAKGLIVIGITVSRWIGREENGLAFDRGGRIDVEISDDHQLPQKRAALAALETAVLVSDKVKKPKEVKPDTGELNDR